MFINRSDADMRIALEISMGPGFIKVQEIDIAFRIHMDYAFAGIVRAQVRVHCRDYDEALLMEEVYYVVGNQLHFQLFFTLPSGSRTSPHGRSLRP